MILIQGSSRICRMLWLERQHLDTPDRISPQSRMEPELNGHPPRRRLPSRDMAKKCCPSLPVLVQPQSCCGSECLDASRAMRYHPERSFAPGVLNAIADQSHPNSRLNMAFKAKAAIIRWQISERRVQPTPGKEEAAPIRFRFQRLEPGSSRLQCDDAANSPAQPCARPGPGYQRQFMRIQTTSKNWSIHEGRFIG